MKLNRISFVQRMVTSAPALTVAISLGNGAHAQQAAPQSPTPGRGQMDGSPVGSQLPGQPWKVLAGRVPSRARSFPGSRSTHLRRLPTRSCCSAERIRRLMGYDA